MGSTLLPGSHHEVLRSVCPRLRGSCRCSPCLRSSPLWSPCCPWVCSALRRPPCCLCSRPLVYNALDTGLVYPVAEAYVHDPTGDVADDASPAAEAYVHDAAGDVSDNSSPEAEAYVHDPTGDA